MIIKTRGDDEMGDKENVGIEFMKRMRKKRKRGGPGWWICHLVMGWLCAHFLVPELIQRWRMISVK